MNTECEWVQEQLPDYLHHVLSPTKGESARWAAVLRHVARCSECRGELAFLARLDELGAEALETPPVGLFQSTLAAARPPQSDPIARIVRGGSPWMVVQLLDYAFAPLQDTLELVRRVI